MKLKSGKSLSAVGLDNGEPIDTLEKERLVFDRDRNLYIFDDSPDMSGLDGRDEERNEINAEPLGLGIGCLEKCCAKSESSSEGTPEEKRERAEALRKQSGPIFAWGPSEELTGIKFGAAAINPTPHALGFPRLATH